MMGGFADIYLDVDDDGTGDVRVVDDTFLISNHSHKANPAQGEPAELPSLEQDPAGAGRAVDSAPH